MMETNVNLLAALHMRLKNQVLFAFSHATALKYYIWMRTFQVAQNCAQIVVHNILY